MAASGSMEGRLWASAIAPDEEMNLGDCIEVMDILPDFIMQERYPEELQDSQELQILDGPEDMWKLLGIQETSQVAKTLMMKEVHPQWKILLNHKLFSREAVVWLRRSVREEVTTVKKTPAEMSGTHYVHSIHTRQERCIPIRFYGRPKLLGIEKSVKKSTEVDDIKEILEKANVVYDAPNILPKGETKRVWYELRPLQSFVIKYNDRADLDDLAKDLFRLHQTIKQMEEYTESTLCMNFSNHPTMEAKCSLLKKAKRKLSKKARFLGEEIVPSSSRDVDACLHILHEEVDQTITSGMDIINKVEPADAAHSSYYPDAVESLKRPLPQRPLNVVFLGKTGVGKSETVNLLVGAPICKASDKPESETAVVKSKEITVKTPIGEIRLNIVDTPGMFDTRLMDPQAIFELRNVIRQCPEGIDVVINTLKVGRFTKEEQDCLTAVEEAAGKDIFKHSVFIFTHGNDVLQNNSAGQYMKTCTTSDKNSTLSTMTKILKDLAGNRAIFIENKDIGELGRKFQRNLILHHIYGILNKTKSKPYSTKMVRQIQKEQEESERKLREIEVCEREKEEKRQKQLLKDQEALKNLKVAHEASLKEKEEIERKNAAAEMRLKEEQKAAAREREAAEQRIKKQEEKAAQARVAAEESSRMLKEEAAKQRAEADRKYKAQQTEAEIQRAAAEQRIQRQETEAASQLAAVERRNQEQLEKAAQEKKEAEEKARKERDAEAAQLRADAALALQVERDKVARDRAAAEQNVKTQREQAAKELAQAQQKVQDLANQKAAHEKSIKEGREANERKEKQKRDFKAEVEGLIPTILADITNEANSKDDALRLIDEKKTHYIPYMSKSYPLLSSDEVRETIIVKIEEAKNSVEYSDNKCFPSHAVVSTPAGEVEMSALKHGDLVLGLGLGGEVQYSPVLLFSHACPDVTAHYVKLHTENQKVLTLTPGHFLHVGQVGALKAAEEVKPGDTVFTYSGKDLVPSVVVSVSEGWERGIYCPQTSSGSIIVDGVVSSCYTTFMAPRVAHALLLPARVLFRVLPMAAYNWLLPYDEASGMPGILNWSAKYVRALKVPFWGGL